MACRFRVPLLGAWLAVSVLAPCRAAEPTFAELLGRAEAQAAAGRQWGPPGDNLTDTFLQMSSMLPSATPEQLVAFEALLHQEQDALAQSAGPPPPAEAPGAPAGSAGTEPAPPPPAEAPPQPAGQPAGTAARPAPAVAASVLFEHGKQAEALGDISAARRFYGRAAQDGHVDAARALARLYDPDYLRRHTVGGIEGDAGLARYWSERANDLGGGKTAAIPEARLAR